MDIRQSTCARCNWVRNPSRACCSCPLNTGAVHLPSRARARTSAKIRGVSSPCLNRAGAVTRFQQGFHRFGSIRDFARIFCSHPLRPHLNPNVTLACARIAPKMREPWGNLEVIASRAGAYCSQKSGSRQILWVIFGFYPASLSDLLRPKSRESDCRRIGVK